MKPTRSRDALLLPANSFFAALHLTQKRFILSNLSAEQPGVLERLDVHGDDICAGGTDLLQKLRVLAGIKERDQRLTSAKMFDFTKLRRPHPRDHVNRRPKFGCRRRYFDARRAIGFIGYSCPLAWTSFDETTKPNFFQVKRAVRSQYDPIFSDDVLTRYANPHSQSALAGRVQSVRRKMRRWIR